MKLTITCFIILSALASFGGISWHRSRVAAQAAQAEAAQLAARGPYWDYYVAATARIRGQLKASSTAVFSGPLESTYTAEPRWLTARGHVDSENSYGAKLRSQWEVVFERRNGSIRSAKLAE